MSKKRFGLDRTSSFSVNSPVNLDVNLSVNLSADSVNSSKKNPFFNFPQKKGQVTLFIILGIIILLAVILTILLRKEVITIKPEELIPTEKGKVERLISACIKDLGEDALFKLGFQGGYVKVPENIANDGSQHLKVSPFQVIPYWAQNQQLKMPSLLQIKREIDLYIEENLRDCVLGLEPFKEVYDIKEKSPLTADTEIVNSKVLFNVRWNVEVRDKDGELVSEVIDHLAESPIKLKKVYEAAVKIVEREMAEMKLEDITQDLIALDHPLLPLTGLDMSCKQKTWDVKKAKSTLQDLLRINLRQLKVKGTDIVQFPEELTYYQNHYVWDIGDSFSASDVEVEFYFDQTYPFLFQVTPSDGNKLRSQTMASGGGGLNILSFLCLQSWKFTYDAVYPVQIRLKDLTTGYHFNVALTVHLLKNRANRGAEVKPRADLILPYTINDEFCQEARLPMQVRTFEKIDNGMDVYQLEPLDKANISYTCIKYRCEMGETKFNYAKSGYQAGLLANFPYCIGGIMRAEKANYKEDWKRVVSKNGEEVELELLPLYPFSIKGLTVVKHEYDEDKDQPLSPEQKMGPNELALLNVRFWKNKAPSPEQPIIPPEETTASTTTTPISTAPEKEKIHEFEQALGSILDPELAKEMKVNFLAKADFTYEVEVKVFNDDSLVAGYKGNWTLSWSDLLEAKEIKIHTLKVSNDDDAYQLLLKPEKYSAVVPAPEVVK
ncbi:hypothetical protein HYU21_00975 [Candidatus Woesearchaeota archaeon]|nr:hypothetical protein [Candidatus Woesearchaeota archaeon]